MERIKVEDVAKLMGVSAQFVRIGMQRGTLPIGHAVKLKRWVYYISVPMFESYTGIKMPPAATGDKSTDNGQKGRLEYTMK
jgi:hypothetical protein